jgi:RNA polymerase sigma-70 factor, ECF subfamily
VHTKSFHTQTVGLSSTGDVFEATSFMYSAVGRGLLAVSESFPAAPFLGVPLGTEKATDAAVSDKAFSVVPEELSDEALLAQVRSGEREALGRLFKRYALLVRSVATRILGDRTEAEDLVQDLFLFIEKKCSIFDSSRSSARSWIIQMTYHRAIERRRYLTNRQFYARRDDDETQKDVVGTLTSESDYSAEAVFGRNGLEKLFESLSEDQRETLRLRFFEGYTLPEIARKMGQTPGNVRHYYYRALEKLRKQMFGTTVGATDRHGK